MVRVTQDLLGEPYLWHGLWVWRHEAWLSCGLSCLTCGTACRSGGMRRSSELRPIMASMMQCTSATSWGRSVSTRTTSRALPAYKARPGGGGGGGQGGSWGRSAHKHQGPGLCPLTSHGQGEGGG